MLEPNFPYKCPFNCSIARSTLVNSSLFSSIDFVSFSILVCNISSAFNFSVSKKHSPKTRSHFESSSAKVISDSASSVSSNCFCLREKSTFYSSCGEKKKCVRTSREAIIARNSCVRLFKRPNAHMRCWSSQLTSTSCFVGGFEVVDGSVAVICIRIRCVCVSEEKREEEEKKDRFKTLNYKFFSMSTKP